MEKEVFKELLKSTASKLGKTLPEFMVIVKDYFNLEVDRLGIISPRNETDKMEVLILVCQNLDKNLKFYDLYSELLKIYDKLYEPFAINEFKQFQLHDDGKIVSSVRGETLLDKYWISVDLNLYGYSVMIGQKTNDVGNAGTSMNTFYNEILTFDELMSTDFKQIVENDRIRSKEKMSEIEEKFSNKNVDVVDNESQDEIQPTTDEEYRKDFAKRYNISEDAYRYFLNCASTFAWDKASKRLVNGVYSKKSIAEIEILDELQQAKLLTYINDERNRSILFKLNALGFVEWEKYKAFQDEIHKQDAGETGSWSQKIVSQQQPKPTQQSAFNEILNKPLQSIVTPTQEIAVQAEILQKNIDDKKQQIEKPFQDTSETSIEDEDVPTSNYYKINDEGKLEMYFDFSDYKNLSEADKKEIKSKFLWSNQRKCWVSRIKNGIYVKDIAKKHNLKYVGREERISFAEQIERKEERAENKIDRYETYSINATKRAANLRSAFDKMRGDWSWLTQPNINSARGRAFTNSRERVFNSLNKSYEENNKAAYYADKAKLANDVLTKPELKDVHYLQNRIKEATTGIKQLEKNIPETQAALEKAIETGKDSWGRELTDERKEQITDWLENSMINLKLYYEKLAYYSMAMENLKAVKEESGEIVFDKPKIIEIAKTTKKLFKEKLGLDVKISSSQSTINVRWGTITDKTLYTKIVQMFYNAKSASEKEYKRGLFSYLNFWYGETGVDAGAATLNEFNKLLSTETIQ